MAAGRKGEEGKGQSSQTTNDRDPHDRTKAHTHHERALDVERKVRVGRLAGLALRKRGQGAGLLRERAQQVRDDVARLGDDEALVLEDGRLEGGIRSEGSIAAVSLANGTREGRMGLRTASAHLAEGVHLPVGEGSEGERTGVSLSTAVKLQPRAHFRPLGASMLGCECDSRQGTGRTERQGSRGVRSMQRFGPAASPALAAGTHLAAPVMDAVVDTKLLEQPQDRLCA